MKMNLQLWSVKDDIAEDFFGTLEKIAKMGYTGVEFAGFGDIPAVDMRRKLDELGLQGISAHVSLEAVTTGFDDTIAYLKTVGAKYVVCPYEKITTVEIALEYAKKFNEIGKKCKAEGLIFGYHNHDHELVLDNGQYPLEVLFENVDPNYVVQEPDIFWVEYAGLNAMEYLTRNKGRCPIIHLKQIRGKDNVDAQDGTIDFKAVYQLCPEAVFVYEQEEYPTGTPLQCVARSAKYLLS